MTIRKDPYDWPTLKMKNTRRYLDALCGTFDICENHPQASLVNDLAHTFKFTRSASNNRQFMEPGGEREPGENPGIVAFVDLRTKRVL